MAKDPTNPADLHAVSDEAILLLDEHTNLFTVCYTRASEILSRAGYESKYRFYNMMRHDIARDMFSATLRRIVEKKGCAPTDGQ